MSNEGNLLGVEYSYAWESYFKCLYVKWGRFTLDAARGRDGFGEVTTTGFFFVGERTFSFTFRDGTKKTARQRKIEAEAYDDYR